MDDGAAGAPAVVSISRVGRGQRRRVELSDGRQLVVSDEAVAGAGLRAGDLADVEKLAELEREEGRVAAHEAALRLLSTRARSERELRTRLSLRGLGQDTIDAEIDRLLRAGLIDDLQFARSWVAHRQQTAPRGKRMLRYELLGRGIDPEAAAEATEGLDDRAAAAAVARTRARSWSETDREKFVTRMGSFLSRRGFTYETAREAAGEAWNERSELSPGSES